MLDQRAERLIRQILLKRKDLTREQIIELVRRKKAEVGSGYLTDTGALYLVASDLGLSIEAQEEYMLDQIKEGMKNIDVIAFFLRQEDTREFIDKKGNKRRYKTIYLYYNDIIRAVLWDDAVELISRLVLKPSEKLKLKGCYIRKGRDGKIELHLNGRGEILIERDRLNEGREKLAKITEDIENINIEKRVHVVKGKVIQPIRILSYTTRDGKQSKAISFRLESLNLVGKSVRVIIWNPSNAIFERIKEDQILRIIGLNLRRGQYTEVELHGDHNTEIEILGTVKKEDIQFVIFSLGKLIGEKINFLLLDKRSKKIYSAWISKSLLDKFEEIHPGNKVKLSLSRVDIKGNTMFINERLEILNETKENLGGFKVKIAELKGDEGPVIVEAMALSKSREQELRTRSGEIIRKSSLLIGDDTGETRVYAWRENTDLLSNILPGERLTFYGVLPRKSPYEDRPVLEVREFTYIERKRS